MTRKGAGYLAIGVGSFMGLGILMNAGEGFGALSFALAMLFCSVLPIGVGVALVRDRGGQGLQARAEQAWQGELLRLAARRGGNLTVAEVVAYADLTPEAAEAQLDRLCRSGLAEPRVSEAGVIVYRVEELLDEEEKRRSQGVLDA